MTNQTKVILKLLAILLVLYGAQYLFNFVNPWLGIAAFVILVLVIINFPIFKNNEK